MPKMDETEFKFPDEQEVEVKTEKLNTAFYAIGTAKELKEKGVTTKEGGFIGLGKSTKVKLAAEETKKLSSTTTEVTEKPEPQELKDANKDEKNKKQLLTRTSL